MTRVFVSVITHRVLYFLVLITPQTLFKMPKRKAHVLARSQNLAKLRKKEQDSEKLAPSQPPAPPPRTLTGNLMLTKY